MSTTSRNLALFACMFVLSACGNDSKTPNNPIVNRAPTANAGLDVTIRLPANSVALNGTVSDDGQPAGAVVSTAWSVSSGPAGATFADVNAVDTTVTFVSEGTYVLELTADDTALQGTDTVEVIVEAAPVLTTVSVTPATASLLTGGAQTFSASGDDQYGDSIATNVAWSATGGTIDVDGNYVAGAVLGDFTVTATDGAVVGTADVTISDSPPTANAGGPYVGIEGAPVALDGSASTDTNNDIVAYDWDLDNDGAFDDATGVDPTFAAAGSGVYTIGLQVTDFDGASNIDSTTVTISNVAPTANAGGPYSGDQGTDIVLDGSASSDPGNDIVTYEWDLNNDGVFDNAIGVNATFNSATPGAFTVGLRVTDADGGSTTAAASVTVNDVAPIADAGGPYSGDQGADIALDASASSDPSGIATYEWDLDNDTVFETAGVNATFNSADAGVFTVGLRVTDNDGTSSTTTASVTVGNTVPVVNPGGPYSGDQGADIALDASASSDPSGIATYEWDLDNDTVFETAGVNATFNSADAGVFTVGLQVTDNDGDTSTTTVNVTVNDLAPVANAGGPYSGDQGADIALDASASSDPSGIATYEWDLDNDTVFETAGVNATFNSADAGVFTVGLRVTDNDGSNATTTVSVTVNDLAPVADAGGPYSGDQGADIPLDASASSDPSGIATYEWDLDNDTVFETAGVNATFNSATTGVFTVGLRVTDGDSNTATTTVGVTVNDLAPVADAGGPYSGDQNADIALDASASSDPSGIATYEWDLDNDTVFETAGVNATFNSADAGVFTVGLQVTDNDGTSATTTVGVTVNDLAPVADAGGPYSGDQNADIALDAAASSDPSGIATYEWDLDNDTVFETAGVNATFNSADAGVFTVGLQVTDNDGSSATTTVSVTVNDLAPVADAGGPYSGDQGADIALDAAASSDPSGIATYEWDLDNDTVFETAGVNATFNSVDAGVFTVGLQVTDNDGSSATTTVGVTVNDLAPVADAGGPYSGDQDADIPLDASASSDPSGIALYEWDLDNNTVFETVGVNATFNSADAGVFTVGLRVTDNDGSNATTTVGVTVNAIGAPPAAPSGLSASGDDGEVSLDWADNAEPDIAGYHVLRSTTPGGPYTDVSGFIVPSAYIDSPVTNGTTYYYVVTAENDAIINSANSAEVATTPNGTVHAFWTLDEGAGLTTADTVLPDDGSGTINGAAWTTGVSGSALDFNGSSDHVVIDNTPELNITGKAISLHAWIFPRDGGSLQGGSRIISKRTDGTNEVFAMLLDEYHLRFRLDGVNLSSSHIIVLNEWVHVAMVYNGTDMRIYINGELDVATPRPKSDPIDFSSHAVHLGMREGQARYFNGIIDEVQIFNSAQIPAGPLVPPLHGPGLFFEDITVAAGVEILPLTGGSHGVMFAEVDDDSDPDFYLTNNWEDLIDRPDHFFDNTNGSVFAEEAGLRGIRDLDGGSHGAVWADLDNDGDYDLVNGTTWDNVTPSSGNPDNDNVFRNDGPGSPGDFTEVTPASIQAVEIETRGITAFDMDGDGDLDLFGVPGSETAGNNAAFLNDGGFTFSSHVGGVLSTAVAMHGVTDTDYDGDGDIDILAANSGGDFAILNNNGAGIFTQILPGTLNITDSANESITTADVDNDGDLDLLLVNGNNIDDANLYLRENDGTYAWHQTFDNFDGYMGGFADLDNDGDQDLVFAGHEFVYMNDGSGTFSFGQSVPVSEIDDPRAIAFADIDSDGDLDFAIAVRQSRNWLVRNDFDSGNSLSVKLVSPSGQVGAFGAKVWVRPAGDSGTLIGMREAKGNHGYFAQDDPVLHFGLGATTLVDVFVDFVECADGTAPIQRLSVDVDATPSIEISGDVCPPP